MNATQRRVLVFTIVLATGVSGVYACPANQTSIICNDGTEISNLISFTVLQMRSGFSYTATVVGLNGFDPVLAVINEDGVGTCNDDAPSAATYEANLPTTGPVAPSSLSAQVTFRPANSAGMQDISLVVGGYNNQPGEFLLILEGMVANAADNGGDPVVVTLTPAMIRSGITLDVYMMARNQSTVDPLVRLLDENYNTLTTASGVQIQCDDFVNALCWPGSSTLDGSSVTIASEQLDCGQHDAYLSLGLSHLLTGKHPDASSLEFMMSGAEETTGEYLAVFHAGT